MGLDLKTIEPLVNIDTGGGFIDATNLSLIAPLAKKGLR